jgi:hypothetical protein
MESSLTVEKTKLPLNILSPAKTSLMLIINYLKKENQIGKNMMPNTSVGIPTIIDVKNIINSGIIKNQLFIDSLCQLLRLPIIPKVQEPVIENQPITT